MTTWRQRVSRGTSIPFDMVLTQSLSCFAAGTPISSNVAGPLPGGLAPGLVDAGAGVAGPGPTLELTLGIGLGLD